MRNIINISLPEKMVKVIKKEIKSGQFSTTSEFFRHLIRTHELVKELEKAEKEFEQGKGKILKSLKDLR